MDFDEEVDGIILVVPVASGVANLLNILPKPRRQLVQVKFWLQR